MADFCRQCCEEVLGIDGDGNDFVGANTPEDSEQGLYVLALCEGCGPTLVDHTGRCMAWGCLRQHNQPNSES